jgi:Na+/H+ antiporter NhaB
LFGLVPLGLEVLTVLPSVTRPTGDAACLTMITTNAIERQNSIHWSKAIILVYLRMIYVSVLAATVPRPNRRR